MRRRTSGAGIPIRRFELRLARNEHGDDMVDVLIDDHRLVDLVRAVELPQARADGQPELAGSYSGLHPSEWAGLPEQWEDGKAAVLGCICGVTACWPLRVRITRTAATVTWRDFEQPNRNWSLAGLGPFRFDAAEYDQAAAEVLRG
jgi:hypothetical protein